MFMFCAPFIAGRATLTKPSSRDRWDEEVADEAARLSLTGISAGYKVKQADNGHIYQYNGSELSQESDAGATVQDSTFGVEGIYANYGGTFNGKPVLDLTTGLRYLLNYDNKEDVEWWFADQPNDGGSVITGSDNDSDYPWNTTYPGGMSVLRADEAGTANWSEVP
jgi:hypothetical protein